MNAGLETDRRSARRPDTELRDHPVAEASELMRAVALVRHLPDERQVVRGADEGIALWDRMVPHLHVRGTTHLVLQDLYERLAVQPRPSDRPDRGAGGPELAEHDTEGFEPAATARRWDEPQIRLDVSNDLDDRHGELGGSLGEQSW